MILIVNIWGAIESDWNLNSRSPKRHEDHMQRERSEMFACVVEKKSV